MAKAAEKHADVFINAGLPIDFIAQLNGAVEDMLGAVSARSQSRGKRKSATTGIKEKLIAGRKVVHVLDAFVKTALKDNTVLLSAWNGVKRVQLQGKRTHVAGVVPAPTPAPVVPAPTVAQGTTGTTNGQAA